jgi:hypothetical protein
MPSTQRALSRHSPPGHAAPSAGSDEHSSTAHVLLLPAHGIDALHRCTSGAAKFGSSGAHPDAMLAGAKIASSEKGQWTSSVVHAAIRVWMAFTQTATSAGLLSVVPSASSSFASADAVTSRHVATSIGGWWPPTQQLENVLQ